MGGVPLDVVLSDAQGRERHVGAEVLGDLTFRSTVPGGFASCSFTLPRPLRLSSWEVQPFVKVRVVDRRNGLVVWQGRLEQPGRSAGGGDGEVRQITAAGTAAHARDLTLPVVYVDRRINVWERVEAQIQPGVTTFEQNFSVTTPTPAHLLLGFSRGAVLTASSRVVCRYPHLLNTAQAIGHYACSLIDGKTDATYRHELVGRRVNLGAAGAAVLDATTFSTVQQDRAVVQEGSGTYDQPEFRINFTGTSGTAVADDTSWTRFGVPVIVPTRKNAAGVELGPGSGVYALSTVTTQQIVQDVLGRFLPLFDGAGASVAASAFAVESLAYEDSTTAERVLADMMLLEPAYRWAAWEDTSAGKARFVWDVWPSAVAHDLDVAGLGFSSPGAVADLYNEVRVRYVDRNGRITGVTRTVNSPLLTAAGVTRRGFLDLGSEAGASSAQAVRAGDAFLEAHRYPTNNGTVTLRRAVADATTGRLLQPWEVRPGVLIRLRGVQPSIDALNASDRDGATVFRVAETAYSARDNAVTLALDSYGSSVARALAAVAKRADLVRRG